MSKCSNFDHSICFHKHQIEPSIYVVSTFQRISFSARVVYHPQYPFTEEIHSSISVWKTTSCNSFCSCLPTSLLLMWNLFCYIAFVASLHICSSPTVLSFKIRMGRYQNSVWLETCGDVLWFWVGSALLCCLNSSPRVQFAFLSTAMHIEVTFSWKHLV